MAIIHKLNVATDNLANALKLRPRIEIEMLVCDAQQIMLELLGTVEEFQKTRDTTILRKRWFSGVKPKGK